MGVFLEHPSVRKRATEERSADETPPLRSIVGSLRVTEHGHTRRRRTNRRFVVFVILWDKPMFPHSTNNTCNRCTLADGPNKRTVEYTLADVWLDRYKQWPV